MKKTSPTHTIKNLSDVYEYDGDCTEKDCLSRQIAWEAGLGLIEEIRRLLKMAGTSA